MDRTDQNIETLCPTDDISAYLDGELSPQAELHLELHLAGCPECTHRLNEQKSLLLALESTLDEPALELPLDFSKSVVAHAESRVSGIRRPRELWLALAIGTGLFVVSVLALGGNAGPAFGVIGAGMALGQVLLHFLLDISLGTAVIIRTLFSNFIGGSPVSLLFFAAAFFGVAAVFSRLYIRRGNS